jgi:TetR/AcrR family transcriptional regulator, cholesterol catabolism regulator
MAAPEIRPGPRELILDAATRLFGEKGYAGTTMRDIAGAVGILPGSLYAHIESKEALLLEIAEVGFDQFLTLAREVAQSDDPPDVRLRRAIVEHVTYVAGSRERTLVVLHQWRYLTGANYERIVEKRQRYERSFAGLVKEGVEAHLFNPELDQRVVVFTILGALNWVPEWFSPRGRASPQEVGRRLADSLLFGIVAKPEEQ